MKRRAFTLAEILVVLFLACTILSMIAQLMLPSFWMWRVESAREDAQQAALRVTSRLQRMLMGSMVETVSLAPDGAAVAFMEPAEAGSPFDATTGAPILAPRFRLFYRDAASRRVAMKLWPPEPPALGGYDFTDSVRKPQRLQAGHFAAVRAQPNGTEQVLARNVESFLITDEDSDPSLLHPPLHCKIVTKVDTSQQGAITAETFQMEVSVTPRCMRW